MASGLKMVKEALGPDALILSTRTIRSGKFGMIGKPMMEITAAVDSTWREPEQPVSPPRREWQSPRPPQPTRPEPRHDISYQEIWAQREPEQPAAPYSPVRPAADREIQDELAELRNMVRGSPTGSPAWTRPACANRTWSRNSPPRPAKAPLTP